LSLRVSVEPSNQRTQLLNLELGVPPDRESALQRASRDEERLACGICGYHAQSFNGQRLTPQPHRVANDTRPL